MSAKPYIVVNSVKRRRRSSSSESSDCSPVRNISSGQLCENIPAQGGFHSCNTCWISYGEREYTAKMLISKLYNITKGGDSELEKVLIKLAPVKECKRRHLIENKQSSVLANNVEIIP